jgi:hypothetical protein
MNGRHFIFILNFFLICFFRIPVLNSQFDDKFLEKIQSVQSRIQKSYQNTGLSNFWNTSAFHKVVKNGKCGINLYTSWEADQVVIPPIYHQIYGPPFAWLIAVRDTAFGKFAIFNLAGEKLSDFKYTRITPITNSTCIFEGAFENNALVSRGIRNSQYDFSLLNYCQFYRLENEKYLYGLINSNMEVLLPTEYQGINYAHDNKFIIQKFDSEGKVDLIDVVSKKFLLSDCDDIKVFHSNLTHPFGFGQSLFYHKKAVFAFKKENYWALLNQDIAPLLPNKYTEMYNKDSLIIARDSLGYSIISMDGKIHVNKISDKVIEVIQWDNKLLYLTEVISGSRYSFKLFEKSKGELATFNEGSLRKDKGGIALIMGENNPYALEDIVAYFYEDPKKGIVILKDLSLREFKR